MERIFYIEPLEIKFIIKYNVSHYTYLGLRYSVDIDLYLPCNTYNLYLNDLLVCPDERVFNHYLTKDVGTLNGTYRVLQSFIYDDGRNKIYEMVEKLIRDTIEKLILIKNENYKKIKKEYGNEFTIKYTI